LAIILDIRFYLFGSYYNIEIHHWVWVKCAYLLMRWFVTKNGQWNNVCGKLGPKCWTYTDTSINWIQLVDIRSVHHQCLIDWRNLYQAISEISPYFSGLCHHTKSMIGQLSIRWAQDLTFACLENKTLLKLIWIKWNLPSGSKTTSSLEDNCIELSTSTNHFILTSPDFFYIISTDHISIYLSI